MMKVIPMVLIRKFIFSLVSLFFFFNVAKVGLLQFLCVIKSSSVYLSLFLCFSVASFKKTSCMNQKTNA